jgi:hypothetical protein
MGLQEKNPARSQTQIFGCPARTLVAVLTEQREGGREKERERQSKEGRQ